MLWTTKRVQLLLALAATGEQPGVVIEAMIAWACGSAEAASVVGVVRRTRFPLFDGLATQKRTEVSATALLALARVESRRV